MVASSIAFRRIFTAAKRSLSGLFLALVLAFSLTHILTATPTVASPNPVALQADELVYDQELGIITARGKVEAYQDDRILLADSVTYNERVDQLVASGNVVIVEPDGTTLFADYIEVTDNFKNGILTGFRLLYKDNSRLAGNSASRLDGNITTLENGIYSPCDLCKSDPTKAPVWQIRAAKVIHNKEDQTISFQNMLLQFSGIPVAYTPYFQIPDPTVKKRSGLLTPEINYDRLLGVSVKEPVYYTITPSADVTLAPTFYSKSSPSIAGLYRQRIENGRFAFDGSITNPERRDNDNNTVDGRDLRGHFRGEGRFNLTEEFRAGFELFRTSDDTYLKRYNISNLDTLLNTAYVEGFRGRSYFQATAYEFQGLRQTDDAGLSPFVLPSITYSYVSEPHNAYGYGTFDANFLSTNRTNGVDTNRVTGTVGWHIPYTSRIGDITTITAQLRGDFYSVDNGRDPEGQPGNFDSTSSRFKPLFALDWRYPLAQSFGTVQHVIEPIANFVATPSGGSQRFIPNEDSRNFEFDDTNIFSLNRLPGYDRYEGGLRVAYGLKTAFYGASGGYTEALFGQSHRFADNNNAFSGDTGLERRQSDYVARVVVSPSTLIDFVDRLRIDEQSLQIRRHEFSTIVGPRPLRLAATYAHIDRDSTTANFGSQEQAVYSAYGQISRFWRVSGSISQDLNDGFIFGYSGVLSYLDECCDFQLIAGRTNTRDREIEPTYRFGFRLRLKNLG